MLTEALKWLNQNIQSVVKVNNQNYIRSYDGGFERVLEDVASPIKIATLNGLVEYINAELDYTSEDHLTVVVKDQRGVYVVSQLNGETNRDCFIESNAELPDVRLDQYMDLEKFNIQLQSVFVDNDDRKAILKLIGNIKSENVKNQSDNGITQSVEVRQGIADVGMATVPNPVYLKPFRTFTEITQPESAFVLRLREGREGVEAALFEADGGAWKNEARASIAEYLKENLKGDNVTILS